MPGVSTKPNLKLALDDACANAEFLAEVMRATRTLHAAGADKLAILEALRRSSYIFNDVIAAIGTVSDAL